MSRLISNIVLSARLAILASKRTLTFESPHHLQDRVRYTVLSL
jgi:hypothetical protein